MEHKRFRFCLPFSVFGHFFFIFCRFQVSLGPDQSLDPLRKREIVESVNLAQLGRALGLQNNDNRFLMQSLTNTNCHIILFTDAILCLVKWKIYLMVFYKYKISFLLTIP
jgi:hypothetical protein